MNFFWVGLLYEHYPRQENLPFHLFYLYVCMHKNPIGLNKLDLNNFKLAFKIDDHVFLILIPGAGYSRARCLIF